VELDIEYGVIILSVSAVLVLLLAMEPLPAAHANTFLIDNFTDDGSGVEAMACDDELVNKNTAGKTLFGFQSGLTEVIAGIRECQLTLLVDNPPETATVTIDEARSQYTGIMGIGVEAMSYLQYDGIADGVVGGGRTLGLDLTNSNNLRIVYSAADIQVGVISTLIDSGGDSASLNGILVAGTNSATELNFPLANFVAQNANLNLNDIDEFNFNFTATAGTDYIVEFIDITMQMTQCQGTLEHWDKVIFVAPVNKLKDPMGGIHKAGNALDYKFLQQPPVGAPVDIRQQTVHHLNTLGWTLGNGAPIQNNNILIIDIDYAVICVDGTMPP